MEDGGKDALQALTRELEGLRSELNELRKGKEEALRDLDLCRTQLQRTQAELSALKQRQEPKEEMHVSKDRYACSERKEGGDQWGMEDGGMHQYVLACLFPPQDTARLHTASHSPSPALPRGAPAAECLP